MTSEHSNPVVATAPIEKEASSSRENDESDRRTLRVRRINPNLGVSPPDKRRALDGPMERECEAPCRHETATDQDGNRIGERRIPPTAEGHDLDYELLERVAMEGIQACAPWSEIERSMVEHMNKFLVALVKCESFFVAVRRADPSGQSCWIFQTERAFQQSLQNREVPYQAKEYAKNGTTTWKKKNKSLSEVWLRSPYRREVDTFQFDPSPGPSTSGAKEKERYLNLFEGLRIDRIEASKSSAAEATPLIEHIRRIWCRSDPGLAEYVLNWLASGVQHPERKLGVALVLRSLKQGAGKGIVGQKLKEIVGKHYKYVSRLDDALGRFNSSVMGDCCLLFIDEPAWRKGDEREQALKALITEPQHRVEIKNGPNLYLNSYVNVILATNGSFAIPASDAGTRRYCCLDLDDRYAGIPTQETKSYFDRLLAVDVKAFARFLYDRDLENFDARQVPRTGMLQEQIEISMTDQQAWWNQCLKSGKILPESEPGTNFGMELTKSDVYRAFVRHQPPHKSVIESVFWKGMKQWVDRKESQTRTVEEPGRSRVTRVRFPSLEEARQQFARFQGFPEWNFK